MSERRVRTARKTPFLECSKGKIRVDKDGMLQEAITGDRDEILDFYINVVGNVDVLPDEEVTVPIIKETAPPVVVPVEPVADPTPTPIVEPVVPIIKETAPPVVVPVEPVKPVESNDNPPTVSEIKKFNKTQLKAELDKLGIEYAEDAHNGPLEFLLIEHYHPKDK